MLGEARAVDPQHDADVLPGEPIGQDFIAVGIIGSGAMGTVVLARETASGSPVAIKILRAHHLSNTEAVNRFLLEGEATQALGNRHLARVLQVGRHLGRPFLVLEYLDGEDLAARVDRGPVPLETATLYVLQACVGMAEAHRAGVIHRDLKPSNLFLAQGAMGGEMVKVLDFGIAKAADGMTEAGRRAMVQTETLVAMGTPLYMSPEQIRSAKAVDARTDIWALGAIAYELVTGKAAFEGASVTNITARVLEADAPRVSALVEVPRAFDELVGKCLEKNVERRFQNVAELAAALEPFAGPSGEGLAAECRQILGLPITDRPAALRRRNRLGIYFFGAVSIVALAALVAVWRTRPTPRGEVLKTDSSPASISPGASPSPVGSETSQPPRAPPPPEIVVSARPSSSVFLGATASTSAPVIPSVRAPLRGPLPGSNRAWTTLPATPTSPAPTPTPAPTPAPAPPSAAPRWDPYSDRN